MSRIDSPTRFGYPTTATLLADLTTEGSILSRRCADVETSVRKLVQLATQPGASEPSLGYHAALVYPERIDHAALASSRDERLRDAQVRLRASLDLIESLLGAR